MNKLFSSLIVVLTFGIAGAGAANAQPLQLSDSQLDHVTAGATAISLGSGLASGTLLSEVLIRANTAVVGSNAIANGDVVSVALSFPGSGATAASSLSLGLTSP